MNHQLPAATRLKDVADFIFALRESAAYINEVIRENRIKGKFTQDLVNNTHAMVTCTQKKDNGTQNNFLNFCSFPVLSTQEKVTFTQENVTFTHEKVNITQEIKTDFY